MSQDHHSCCGPGYASVEAAMKADREKIIYTVALYTGTSIEAPDYLATIDVDPNSPTYSQVIHRLQMPYIGDELHHFGWNACSSCHGDASKSRRFLIIPGQRSTRIYIIDTQEQRAPKIHKIIEPEEIKAKTNLSAPHTVHCLANGTVMISMLGDSVGNGPGGFLLLDENFDLVGHWEKNAEGMSFNYDFWYQPRHNIMVSSEWGAPKTYYPGFDLEDVKAGNYGRKLHFWDWSTHSILQSVDLGEEGLIPLEVRFHHNPDSTEGFVGAALSSNIWHWWKNNGHWTVEKIIDIPSVNVEGWPIPVPSLITDLLISLNDKYLYFSNWLHGNICQYDISDPKHPKLTAQVWCGGLLGRGETIKGRKIAGGPQMLQLSLDGKRLYVTDSLFSSWDNQFYPDLASSGSTLFLIDCDSENGGMEINENFCVDFGQEPNGPARAHEIRYPGGDVTSDIWV
ncbi:selenium-binding family protein [Gloeothece verrucosa]|uniref:Methanethiol oxidase n=1 Tax=Gloeothece verrucosa (strain PCC 7822) TaxID=497965 RepID=E0UBQ4_GLOV7|nr:selenium-binding family protein [Gloeothece verrucosa]ADN13998.1 selenium-binding protein [Gloeothece verrucosa PCC 7822]